MVSRTYFNPPPHTHTHQAAAAKFNVPAFSGDAMDVITHPDVDAVWICSPSQFHADQVRTAVAVAYSSLWLTRYAGFLRRCACPRFVSLRLAGTGLFARSLT